MPPEDKICSRRSRAWPPPSPRRSAFSPSRRRSSRRLAPPAGLDAPLESPACRRRRHHTTALRHLRAHTSPMAGPHACLLPDHSRARRRSATATPPRARAPQRARRSTAARSSAAIAGPAYALNPECDQMSLDAAASCSSRRSAPHSPGSDWTAHCSETLSALSASTRSMTGSGTPGSPLV